MDMNLRTICPCLAAALLAACAPRTPDVTTEPFGTLSTGEPVTLYRLSNGTGSSMEVIDYGCRVVRICVPDRNGRIDDVVVFNALNMTNIEPIVDLQLEEVRDRLADRRIRDHGDRHRRGLADRLTGDHGELREKITDFSLSHVRRRKSRKRMICT